MGSVTQERSKWLEKVAASEQKLISFLRNYHPVYLEGPSSMPITAAAAERACEVIRKEIQAETPKDPVQQFKQAIAEGDVEAIDSLLNAAWFGVPESTACWGIEGFSEAVDLMDDVPYEPQEADSE